MMNNKYINNFFVKQYVLPSPNSDVFSFIQYNPNAMVLIITSLICLNTLYLISFKSIPYPFHDDNIEYDTCTIHIMYFSINSINICNKM